MKLWTYSFTGYQFNECDSSRTCATLVCQLFRSRNARVQGHCSPSLTKAGTLMLLERTPAPSTLILMMYRDRNWPARLCVARGLMVVPGYLS